MAAIHLLVHRLQEQFSNKLLVDDDRILILTFQLPGILHDGDFALLSPVLEWWYQLTIVSVFGILLKQAFWQGSMGGTFSSFVKGNGDDWSLRSSMGVGRPRVFWLGPRCALQRGVPDPIHGSFGLDPHTRLPLTGIWPFTLFCFLTLFVFPFLSPATCHLCRYYFGYGPTSVSMDHCTYSLLLRQPKNDLTNGMDGCLWISHTIGLDHSLFIDCWAGFAK
jgi:hypothetical protein